MKTQELSKQNQWAEIFKVAFDLTKDGVMSIVDALKKVAPDAWKMTKKSIYSEVIGNFITSLIALTVTIPAFYFAFQYYSTSSSRGDFPGALAFFVGAGVLASFIYFLCSVSDFISRVFAADYHTLARIIELIRNEQESE